MAVAVKWRHSLAVLACLVCVNQMKNGIGEWNVGYL